jgi:hypothetical protein
MPANPAATALDDHHRPLRAGSTQGFVSLRKGNISKSYGARAVVWHELPNDAAEQSLSYSATDSTEEDHSQSHASLRYCLERRFKAQTVVISEACLLHQRT